MKPQWTSAYKANPPEPGVYECYSSADAEIEKFRWNGSGYRAGWRSLDNEYPAPFPAGPRDKWRPIDYGMAA